MRWREMRERFRGRPAGMAALCLSIWATGFVAIPEVRAQAAHWQVAGPYMQEGKGPQELFDIVFPPEKPGEKGIQWKDAGSGDLSGGWQVDLTQVVGGENRCAYLKTEIKSQKDQDASLGLGSDDGIKVWLNGSLVHANNVLRGVTPGEDKVNIKLKKGANTLLLKITQGGGGWGASVQVGGAGGISSAVVSDVPWETSPTLEAIYANYKPSFSGKDGSSADELKYSKQPNYMSMADVQMDSRVWPIIKKANEMVAAGEHRKATELYRRVLKEHPDELVQIAPEGIFIPASLYVQRQILRYPEKELTYYRILFDPAAKEIYERAVRRYSIYDYKDLERFHLATSYGDDALFALGNDALDQGKYDEARRDYEQIVSYHGLVDNDRDEIKLDREQVWVRLAICYKYLGRDAQHDKAVAMIRSKDDETVSRLFKQLQQFQYNEFEVRQREGRRSAMHDAMDDRKLSEPMPYVFSANRGEWEAKLANRSADFSRCVEPDVLPWATESDLIYKDMNVLYSRSLLTGALNWVFGPGGSSWDWDRYGWGHARATYPSQGILVHDGVVFAHMFVYGPSLVAVDQYTGRMLWAKGPMAAQTEDEWLDRYQAAPAAGRGMIVAPVTHDDIRGRSHISSSADLVAFEPRSGKMLWRTTLSRISPLKITQSRYPRKIRILSTTPIIKDGVVYHVTNAGIMAAVDAGTGNVIWLTRYPQRKDVLDNFANIPDCWRNESPLIRGNRLYATPVDTDRVLCVDKDTGRVVWEAGRGWWYMAGFASDGTLCMRGDNLAFLDPQTGKAVHGMWGVWADDQGANTPKLRGTPSKGLTPGINGEGEDFWWPLGNVHQPPTLTTDGKAYFAMQFWFGEPGPRQAPFNSEYVYDIKERKVAQQRKWYDPVSFISTFGYASSLPVIKRPVNEEPESFDPAMRMAFKRWDVPFEVDITYDHLVTRYDPGKLDSALAKQKTLETVFAKAELARRRGDVQGAIRQYEETKPLLPSEEEDRRRNINLRLYPLYTEVARWGHQAADYGMLEEACKKMGATASNPSQEIRALLAYAELHEKKGRWGKAIQVLQNASRHYWREPLPVSGIELGDRDELMKLAEKGLQMLMGEIPGLYRDEGQQVSLGEKAALTDYWLGVANVDEDFVVETRGLIAKRMREVLKRAPEDVRKQYEKEAEEELKGYEGLDVGERLLWCWAESAAGSRKLKELEKKAGALKEVERQAELWRLADLAEACGFGEDRVADGKKGLEKLPWPTGMAAGEGVKQAEEANEDPDMVRLTLAQKGEVERTGHLMFMGGRKKRTYGNRFTVTCWNLKENRREWESRDILLGGKTMEGEGYEVGFEEVVSYGDFAIVHGRYDVIALDWRKGKDEGEGGKKEKRWHFRVPMGFEIRAADLCGEVLVLCGRGSTIGLSPKTGEILWEVAEMGEYYAGPFIWKDEVLTVRNSPSEVSFRRVGTGRLLARLRLPGLTTNRKHPIYAGESGAQNPRAAEAAEAYPVAFGEGVVAVSDGTRYHVVDVAKKQIRWSQAATKLDMSTDPAYRFWVDGGRLFVLKPYYSVLENAVFDLASGDLLWRRREGGKKVDEKLKNVADSKEAAQGTQATGLILSSMVFIGGKVYGIRYEMGGSSVALVGMDPVTGNELMRVEEKGYTDAEAYVERSWSKDCAVVRIQDENKFELWQVDVAAKKRVQRVEMDGHGRLGEYGEVSAVWQGPNLAIWTYEKRKFAAGGGK